MKSIPYNPYIVGNPIKTREMFFGREDDFQFVARKIGTGVSNQVLVFCGERRSGKTSILFQILGGRLGKRFLPILVDMQILAGIRDDDHFFRTILKVACDSLAVEGLSLEAIESQAPSSRVEELFGRFLTAVESRFPERIVLFLLDEYELIEEKIRDGSLSESTIHYLSGTLESPHPISFIFTGSTNLENRKVSYWKSLLGKSIYRKISYLSKNDTARLISEPLKDYVQYPGELIDSIYRLTGGQPFYTQVICQNLTDQLIEEDRTDPGRSDLEAIVKGIVDNPLPQMIYSWNSLQESDRLLLAALAGLLESPESWAAPGEVMSHFRTTRLKLPFSREQVNMLLEEAYHKEYLDKESGEPETGERYRFRMDLMRRWIRREHSIWKVAKEVGIQPKRRVTVALWAVIAVVAIGALAGAWFGVLRPRIAARAVVAAAAGSGAASVQATPSGSAVEEDAPADSAALQEVRDVRLAANAAPFRVTIDERLNLTSEGLDDESAIVVPALSRGEHSFVFHNPATGEEIPLSLWIGEDDQQVEISFRSRAPVGEEQSAQRERPARAQEEASATPESRSAEQAEIGSLLLSSNPPGARILIDGEDSGQDTPAVFEGLAPGIHRADLVLEGYREQYVEVEVVAGQVLKRELDLVESFGEVVFDVRPTARIFLDGEPLIETPYARPVRVRSGRHRITIVNDSLKIRKDREIDVPIDGRITVQEVLQ